MKHFIIFIIILLCLWGCDLLLPNNTINPAVDENGTATQTNPEKPVLKNLGFIYTNINQTYATLFDTTPLFTWHPVDGASGFHLQISSTSDFSKILVDINSIPAGEEFLLPIDQALPAYGVFYWRLRAVGSDESWSEWSDYSTFAIKLSIPEFLTPSCRVLSGTKPVLNWENYDSRYYKHVSAYNSAFELQMASQENNLDSAPIIKIEKKAAYLESVQYTLDRNMTAGEQLFWRVRVINEDNATGNWSETASFDVVDIIPIDTKTIGSGDRAIDFVYVPSGTFEMGSDDGWGKSRPKHSVTLTKGFWISKYEITNAQWSAYIDDNTTADNLPVQASWNGAQIFISVFNTENNSSTTLPTEAQWEWAAKGATRSTGYNFSGSSNLWEVAWAYRYPTELSYAGTIYQPFDQFQLVGNKLANELGIYDMSGNISEWCLDIYNDYNSTSQIDPTGPATAGEYGTDRILRGGTGYEHLSSYTNFNVIYRINSDVDSVSGHGFRVVLPAE